MGCNTLTAHHTWHQNSKRELLNYPLATLIAAASERSLCCQPTNHIRKALRLQTVGPDSALEVIEAKSRNGQKREELKVGEG